MDRSAEKKWSDSWHPRSRAQDEGRSAFHNYTPNETRSQYQEWIQASRKRGIGANGDIQQNVKKTEWKEVYEMLDQSFSRKKGSMPAHSHPITAIPPESAYE